MKRDFHALKSGHFDVLVVGGGIHGAWTAYDATLRGLRVALVEKEDWGSGTSQASSKLIHGGLRYLEQMRLGLVRQSLHERQRLLELAPHQVWPLSFGLPIYQGGRLNALLLKPGLMLYDRMAGIKAAQGGHQQLNAAQALQRWPFLQAQGLKSGFVYPDAQMDDARMTLELVLGAIQAGAVAVNHCSAQALLCSKGRVWGAAVRDEETGETHELLAHQTVLAAGPWCDGLLQNTHAAPIQRLLRLNKGVHVVLPALPTRDGLFLTAKRDGRVFFVLPWLGRTLVGTTDTDYTGDPDHVLPEKEDVAYLLEEAAGYLPGQGWDEHSVLAAFAGVRALRHVPGQPSAVTRELSLEEPLPGLHVPVGGKFTTARVAAERLVERIMKRLGHRIGPSPTAQRLFPRMPNREQPFGPWLQHTTHRLTQCGLDSQTAQESARRYGTDAVLLEALLTDQPPLAQRIHPSLPYAQAEILLAVNREMARTLPDILRRRIPLALLERLDTPLLAQVAKLAAQPLGWDAARQAREVAAWEAEAPSP